MKRFVVLIIAFLLSALSLSAQTLEVKSFYEEQLPDGTIDISARVAGAKDDNGKPCALIKIKTVEHIFVDGLVPCAEIKYKIGEADIYISYLESSINIMVKGYKLLEYVFPIAIKPGHVYVMDIVTKKPSEPKGYTPSENFLALSVSPPDASVQVDGKTLFDESNGKGQYQPLLPIGKHTYEISNDMYHTAKGEFVISPDSTTTLDISLKPNFGYIKVNSTPEAAATVRINNSSAGKTPYTSDRLRSGVYTVSVFKAMYQSATQEVTVTDGETSAITLAMAPDFAEPVITCSDPHAEIWVNGEKKGVGSWNGRLAAGVYKIKASRKSHIDTEKAFTLNAGDNTQIDLDPPTPIYGFLQVASTPFAADIYLDGQKVGTTPKLLNNILIGDHELRIEKNDYATEVRNIKVEENKTTDISVELKNRETIKRTESVRTEENVYTDLASTETGNKAKRHHFAWITFVTLNGSYSPLPQFAYGITVGQMRFCGWYVSLMSNFNFRGAFKNFKVGETYSLTGSSKTTRLSVIGGFVLHPSNILALSIGAGFGYRSMNLQTVDDKWYSYKPRTFLGADVAFGFMISLNKFLFSAEIVTTNFKTIEFKLGLGLYHQ